MKTLITPATAVRLLRITQPVDLPFSVPLFLTILSAAREIAVSRADYFDSTLVAQGKHGRNF